MAFVGERLKSLRDENGLTQEELASYAQSSQGMIARYESGKAVPTADVVARLAAFFNVTADFLLGLTDDPRGYITEDDLSPLERRLIAAFRRGEISEALDIVAELAKSKR